MAEELHRALPALVDDAHPEPAQNGGIGAVAPWTDSAGTAFRARLIANRLKLETNRLTRMLHLIAVRESVDFSQTEPSLLSRIVHWRLMCLHPLEKRGSRRRPNAPGNSDPGSNCGTRYRSKLRHLERPRLPRYGLVPSVSVWTHRLHTNHAVRYRYISKDGRIRHLTIFNRRRSMKMENRCDWT